VELTIASTGESRIKGCEPKSTAMKPNSQKDVPDRFGSREQEARSGKTRENGGKIRKT